MTTAQTTTTFTAYQFRNGLLHSTVTHTDVNRLVASANYWQKAISGAWIITRDDDKLTVIARSDNADGLDETLSKALELLTAPPEPKWGHESYPNMP
jgi:hypothetical protein